MDEPLNGDKIWMAALDGELSAAETAGFEADLSPRDAARFQGEVRLEGELSRRLQQGCACPAALWEEIGARMERGTGGAWRKLPGRNQVALLLAASLALMVGGFWVATPFLDLPWNEARDNGQTYAIPAEMMAGVMSIKEPTITAFAMRSETDAALESIQTFLEDHAIHLKLTQFSEANPASHHRVKLLGACMGVCPKGSLVEILFSCCDVPAKLVITEAGASGEQLLRKAAARGEVQHITSVDRFLVGVVSSHDAQELIRLVKPQQANLV